MQREREGDLFSFINGQPTALDCSDLSLSQSETSQLHAADPLSLPKEKTPNPAECIPLEPYNGKES